MTSIWARKGHHITVLAGMVHYNTGIKGKEYRGKLFKGEEHAANVDVIRCHVSEAYNKNFLGRFWGYLSFTLYSTWAGLFKTDKKYDLILATSPPLFTGLSARFLSLFKRIPYVFEVRDLWPESAIDAGVLRNKVLIKLSFWLEAITYRGAKKINVLTPAFREKLIKHKNVDPEKIIYIPNGADFSISDVIAESFDATHFRKAHNLPLDSFLIIYVGAHGLANGLEIVPEAAAMLTDRPVVFLLIGTGMEKRKLVKQVNERDLTNVLFFDPVPKTEVFKYILASDAGLSILMKADTFKTIYSNKTFDYMSCKKPVIMAIDGISRKLVEEAGCGIYVEPGNAADLAEKVKLSIDSRSTFEKQGLKGFEYAKKHFDRENLAEKYMVNLEEIISTKNSK
jgi:glycosyltransferase involved in cell wall biosynthesis